MLHHGSMFYLWTLFLTLSSRIIPTLGSADVTDEVFGGYNKDIFPVAFADYDGDKRVDMFVLTRNLSSIDIFFGSTTRPYLQQRPGQHCDFSYKKNGNKHKVLIVGLMLADFTGDGVNDICVSFKPDDRNADSDPTFVAIIRGDLDHLHCADSLIRLNGTSSYLELRNEPIILDANGDMIADLFGEVKEGKRMIWVFRQDSSPKEIPFHCGESDCSKLSLSYPTSGGFVDIDGDFSPDLVVISQGKLREKDDTPLYYVEVYGIDRSATDLEFIQKNLIKLDAITMWKIGNPLFLDLNLTGKELQIVIPYCHNVRCRASGLAMVEVRTQVVKSLDVKFEDSHGRKWTFLDLNPIGNFDYSRTINIRAGDFDLDGYPDLICTLVETGVSSSQAETRSVLFMNVPCEKDCAYPRSFKPNFDLLAGYKNSLNTAFYDFNENGLLDIIGLRRLSARDSRNATYGVFVMENTPEYDSYFVKWLITTGRCAGTCPPYGVMTLGASMKYSTMDLNNKDKSGRASQVIRGNFALDLPGWLMGTGSSPNFIDKVVFGTSYDNTLVMLQIIPNSNLIAIPSKDGKSRWEVKHLITPSVDGAISTFHVLLLICIVNASIVFLFHLRERKEDRLERSKNPVSMSALTFT